MSQEYKESLANAEYERAITELGRCIVELMWVRQRFIDGEIKEVALNNALNRYSCAFL
jgi:hypothetical protein